MQFEQRIEVIIVIRLLVLLSTVSLLINGIFLNADSFANKKIIFKLNSVTYGKHVGYYIAKKRGIYRAAGMKVSLLPGRGDAWKSVVKTFNKDAAIGEADFAIARIESPIIGRSIGSNIKMISIWHRRAMYGVLALKSSRIRTPWNLEGKRLGVTFGNSLHRYWPFFEEIIGLKNVRWTHLPPDAKNHYLLTKKVDAILVLATTTIPIRYQAAMVGEEVVELLWSDYGFRLPADGIVTSDEMIATDPNQVRAFVNACLEGNAWAIENPKKAVKIFLKDHPDQHPKITRHWWDLSSKFQVLGSQITKGLGHMDPEDMRRAYNTAVRAFEIANPPVLSDWYTTKFLPKNLPKPKPQKERILKGM